MQKRLTVYSFHMPCGRFACTTCPVEHIIDAHRVVTTSSQVLQLPLCSQVSSQGLKREAWSRHLRDSSQQKIFYCISPGKKCISTLRLCSLCQCCVKLTAHTKVVSLEFFCQLVLPTPSYRQNQHVNQNSS